MNASETTRAKDRRIVIRSVVSDLFMLPPPARSGEQKYWDFGIATAIKAGFPGDGPALGNRPHYAPNESLAGGNRQDWAIWFHGYTGPGQLSGDR